MVIPEIDSSIYTRNNIVEEEHLLNVVKNLKPHKYDFNMKSLDLIHESIDLNKEFVECPSTSFLIRVEGTSMVNAGINNGDILLVDRSKKASHESIVVAAINGRLTVKRLFYSYKETLLLAENEDFMPIFVKPGDKLDIWGVATMVIKEL